MNNKILTPLDYRIDIISELKDLLIQSKSNDNKEILARLYNEIAYFVHTIYTTDKLAFLFKELLSYSSNLKNNEEYVNKVKEIRGSINTIARIVLSNKKFNEFEESEKNNGWKNPFDQIPITLKVRSLLEGLENFKDNSLILSFEEIYTLFWNTDGLNGLLNRFYSITNCTIAEIDFELESFRNNLLILSFHSKFQSDYMGVDSAIFLQRIYEVMLPIISTPNPYISLFWKTIQLGENNNKTNYFILHCKRVREYFNQKLTARFSIDFEIDRFKHYMEIFQREENVAKDERYFQREFELFMFHSGYYALSQGQIGNGRFDNLIMELSENNAFLFEHKQIGFGDTSVTKQNYIDKLKSAKIQTHIYHERLKLFPRLSSNVYIIIFSNYYIEFKDDLSQLQRDGLNFNFKLVCLNQDSPSKARSKSNYKIDINELFNYQKNK